jgi:hypothetical protein
VQASRAVDSAIACQQTVARDGGHAAVGRRPAISRPSPDQIHDLDDEIRARGETIIELDLLLFG